MPKRKMTPARKAQIRKWQAAGAKARKNLAGKKIPRSSYSTKKGRGPMVTLYHVTTAAGARSIRANGFQWKEGRSLSMAGVKDPIWFSTKRPSLNNNGLDWVSEKFGKPIGKRKVNIDGIPTIKFIYPKQYLFSVRIPYRKTKRDKHVPPGSKHIPSRVVSAAYLSGKKIRELK